MSNLWCSSCRKTNDGICMVNGTSICTECLEKAAQAAAKEELALGNAVATIVKENDIYD